MTPRQVERFRVPLHASNLLEIAGPVQNVEDVVHVKLRHLAPLDLSGELPPSRSYRLTALAPQSPGKAGARGGPKPARPT